MLAETTPIIRHKASFTAHINALADVPSPAPEQAATERPTRIRTAAQCLEDAHNAPPLVALVGGLWETPGIAFLVGDTGVGKSVFAVHIAHLISSAETALLGLPCNTRQRVLYWDFELTDRQFLKRFDGFPFTSDFLRADTNPVALDVESFTFEHIAADIDRTGATVVILDNISALALKTTADADISLGIMKGLQRLKVERGISSLVLAHTPKLLPGSALNLNHLAGSKHLSNFADSVFFLGRSVQGPRTRYVKQVKNRTDEELPGVLVCELNTDAGYLGFTLVGPDEEAPHLAAPADEQAATQRKAPLDEVTAELPMALAQPQSAGALEATLAAHFTTDIRTIRKRLKELADAGAGVLDLHGQLCTISKEQRGRETWFSLRPVPASA